MPYRHDYDKILTRLVTILSRLDHGEALSVKELAKEFGVSERTIRRDLNERLSAFPLYQENRKWKMDEDFRLQKVTTLEDRLVLDILQKLGEGLGGVFAQKSRTLLSRLKNGTPDALYTKLYFEDIAHKMKELEILEEAIGAKRQVSFFYENRARQVSAVVAMPLKIVNFEGYWYLLALHEGNLRKYYLKNISSLQVLEQEFVSGIDIDSYLQQAVSIWFDDTKTPYEVLLYADSTASRYFRRKPLPTQKITALHEDGAMEFSVSITHEMEIVPLVLQWLPHLFVRSPRHIKEAIDDRVERYRSQCSEIVEYA